MKAAPGAGTWRPGALAGPHLYFWKSAKWVRGLRLVDRMNRASGSRLAIIIMVIHGKKNATGATNLATR